MTELKAYLLCRVAEQSSIYTSWLNESPIPTVVVDEYLPDWNAPDDAGILITHMHYRWEDISMLRRIHQQNRVPILILCDGILEYRNTWQHEGLADGSMFQPACAHKLACLGRAPARIFESWGNVGRCEIVGLPRLDAVLEAKPHPIHSKGPFRLLIATATTPFFDEKQRRTVVHSLQVLQRMLLTMPTIGGRPVQTEWRLTEGLEIELGLPSTDPDSLPPLGQVICNVDAVITTPSTIYLESVLRKRPTALLDFHNCPQYISAAWNLTAESQFEAVLQELANPPAAKMLFQSTMLHDQLECQAPSTPRLIELILSMVNERRRSAASLTPLSFPARILADAQHGIARVPAEFDLSALYENNESFASQDVQRLQIELAAAIKRLESLPLELADKNQLVAQLNRAADRSRVRIEDMHNRVVSIRKRFGVLPETKDKQND